MIKLTEILKETLKVRSVQVKKLNKRLIDKGYEDFEFALLDDGTLKVYYKDWRKNANASEEDRYTYGLLQSFIHTANNFNDLYYAI